MYILQSALKQAQMLGSSESRGKPQDVAREATGLKAKIKLSSCHSRHHYVFALALETSKINRHLEVRVTQIGKEYRS